MPGTVNQKAFNSLLQKAFQCSNVPGIYTAILTLGFVITEHLVILVPPFTPLISNGLGKWCVLWALLLSIISQ